MKNEIEQLIFEKMKAKDFGESMCNETKLNVLKWTMQQLRKHDVSGSLPYSIYEEELNKIKQLPQTQTSLMKQCEILRIFANKLGLYDAADFLRKDS